MTYRVTILYPDRTHRTEFPNDIPDYASLNHALDKCEITAFTVSLKHDQI